MADPDVICTAEYEFVPAPEEHECGSWCSRIEEEQINRMKGQVTVPKDGVYLKKSSPFAAPFALGWERFEYHYNTPCGKKLYDMKQILKYLITTSSRLSIRQFTFNNDFTYISIPTNPDDKVICDDVSGGKEAIAIRCINNVDDAVIDPNFEYVMKNIYPPEINREAKKFRSSCSCTDDCKDLIKCKCRHLTDEAEDLGQLPGFDSRFFAGYYGIEKELPRPYVFGLYECNQGCRCSHKCFNRLVQNGMSNQLEVFRTDDGRGWGLRCRHDLQSGDFVATYSGEVISYLESEKRGTENDEYFTKLNLIEMVEQKEGFEEFAPEMSEDEDEVSKKVKEGSQSEASELSEESIISDVSSLPSTDEDVVEFVYKRDRNKRVVEGGNLKNKRKKFKMDNLTSKVDWKDIDSFVSVRKYIADNAEKDNKNENQTETSPPSEDTSNSKKPEIEPTKEGSQESIDEAMDKFRYLIDAKRKGNVGRFLNHSCKPNCYLQIVFTDTHDPRMYQLAFFTTEKVKAMTELTWNYCYHKDDKNKFKCLCEVCKEKEKSDDEEEKMN